MFGGRGKSVNWNELRKKTSADKKGHIRRGVGMASAVWFVGGGGPPSTVIVKLFSDGSVNLNMGASDIGTGTKTVMAMVVSEELGVKPDVIQIEHADTAPRSMRHRAREQDHTDRVSCCARCSDRGQAAGA